MSVFVDGLTEPFSMRQDEGEQEEDSAPTPRHSNIINPIFDTSPPAELLPPSAAVSLELPQGVLYCTVSVSLLAPSSGLSSHGYSCIIFSLRFCHAAKEDQNIT